MKERGHNYEKPKQKKIDLELARKVALKPWGRGSIPRNVCCCCFFSYFLKAHFDKLCKNKGKFIYTSEPKRSFIKLFCRIHAGVVHLQPKVSAGFALISIYCKLPFLKNKNVSMETASLLNHGADQTERSIYKRLPSLWSAVWMGTIAF